MSVNESGLQVERLREMELIDTHCHFDFPEFDHDRDTVWRRGHGLNIRGLVVPGVSPEQWPRARLLADTHHDIYFSVGLHPWWIETFIAKYSGHHTAQSALRSAIEKDSYHKRCIALGECGLDKNIETPLNVQQEFVDIHCELAVSLDKPLIIHSVKTHDLMFNVVKKHGVHRGIIHAFSGSAEQALAFCRLGLGLGVGGTITYERANKTREAIKRAPLEHLVLETDAPDMPLHGKQGERNSPCYLPQIAQTLADLRGEPYELICRKTYENSQRIFSCNF